MKLNELLKKRLIFISGKGGVGKTTVSLLLGLHAAQAGKKTLLVELNSHGLIHSFFDLQPQIQTEIPLQKNLTSLTLFPQKCFEEYVIQQIKWKALYHTFFSNKYVTNFLEAVPGLNEILMLGKIYDLEKKGQYDLIIVDSPATGHSLSLLEVPEVVKKVVVIGPIRHQADEVTQLLTDHQKTALCVVTLAEEMPVAETEEYVKKVQETLPIQLGGLFINQVMSPLAHIKKSEALKSSLQIYWDYYQLTQSRAQLNRHYLERIQNNFSFLDQIILPFQFSRLKNHTHFKSLLASLKEFSHAE